MSPNPTPASALAHTVLLPDHLGAFTLALAVIALVAIARWLARRRDPLGAP